jgi:translation initiation factor IF-2
VEGMKVFEFAKEIGVETLGLMDKIRKWNIPVKSHMATLEPDVMDLIRDKLAEESPKKKTKKKAKKKATKATAEKKKTTKKAKKATSAPKKVAKKTTATKKTVTKKKAATTTATAAPEAASGTKVIRRRATEIPSMKKASDEVAPVEEAAPISPIAPEEEPAAKETAVQTPVTPEAEPMQGEVAAAATTEVKAPAKEDAIPEAAAKTAATEAPKTEEKAKAAPGVKRVFDMKTGKGDGAPAPRSRGRNIVGKMDLSKVSSYKSTKTQAPQQNRSLRPGFAPADSAKPNLDDFVVEERKDDRDRDKKKVKAGVGTRTEGKEEVVPTFEATEYRKREMLFQPKKKKGILNREAKQTKITQPAAHKRIVKVDGVITVSDLAKEMSVKVPQLLTTMIKSGIKANINDTIDVDTATLIATEFNFEVQDVHKTIDDLFDEAAFGELDAEPVLRPPVVTVMGHVDHGKTTLLDAIRSADVVSTEAGGITQHIGAYNVTLPDGGKITFIDTPGHAAFTAMRARGANVTDIVILIVAADDGVMPQTIEAINHAKAAEVPIVVVVNKIDRPGANPDKIKQQLAEYELIPEDWGGDTVFCDVSALKKEGIDSVLENLNLIAEMAELKANPKRSGTGLVIESQMEKGRGIVATLLVKDGSVRIGHYIAAGKSKGRIRAMFDDRGTAIKEVLPGEPVRILGLDSTPTAGDRFDICQDEAAAERISAHNRHLEEAEAAAKSAKGVSLEDLFANIQAGAVKDLPIILKTDVAGSSEAIKGSLEKLSTDEVKVNIIHSAVGGITESDVLLATSAKGIVLGFNVRPDLSAQKIASSNGIEVKIYSVIYELIDDVKAALSGLLAPDIVENTLGHAEVRELFKVPKIGTIAGCYVTDGKMHRTNLVRLVRDNIVIYEGKMFSLKRFKDDVREVAAGYECGIGIENFNDIKVGDVIEGFEKKEVAREI